MTEKPDDRESTAQHDRIAGRAELLPEEDAAGSDDPTRQAQEILRDSDERTAHPDESGAESTQTSSPDERPQP
jgi:hypothetical protein